MALEQGDFVMNKKVPEWGIGKVLGNIGEKPRIFFENAGEKLMAAEAALEKVESDDSHPLLKYVNAETHFTKFKPPKELEQDFLDLFPEGFRDPEYLDEERNYKVDASAFIGEVLAEERLKAFLDKGEYEEIAKAAKQAIGKTNLIFPNEIMDLNDALKVKDNGKLFAESIYYHLYSNDLLRGRFESFVGVLKKIHAAKWTIATYFLHLRFPEEYPFMKPEVTKRAAESFGFQLNYSSGIEWDTYERLLDFARYVAKKISSNPILEPRDMIDIQGFMWCGDPSKYSFKERQRIEEKRKTRISGK